MKLPVKVLERYRGVVRAVLVVRRGFQCLKSDQRSVSARDSDKNLLFPGANLNASERSIPRLRYRPENLVWPMQPAGRLH